MKTKVKNDNEKIKQKWFDFIIEPLLNEEGKESINNNNNTNTFGNIGLNTKIMISTGKNDKTNFSNKYYINRIYFPRQK